MRSELAEKGEWSRGVLRLPVHFGLQRAGLQAREYEREKERARARRFENKQKPIVYL